MRSDNENNKRPREVLLTPPPRLPDATPQASRIHPREDAPPRASGPGLLLAAAALALFAVGAVSLLTRPRMASEVPPADPVHRSIPETLEAEVTPGPEPGALASEETPPTPAEAPAPRAESTVILPEKAPPPAPSLDAFVAAMSAGLLALGREDPGAAQLAFKEAILLRPEAPEALDALAQAEEALRLAHLLDLQGRARELEAKEEWRQAATLHQQALAVVPSLEIARAGEQQCAERAELSDLLDYHLRHGERLASDEVFNEASALLARTESLVPEGPRLLAQRASLEKLLRRAATPIRAILESDELTHVVVFRVGELGTFRRQELDLRPGSYTVVGHRSGYRDVRLTWKIAPGEASPTLTVRCEEEI